MKTRSIPYAHSRNTSKAAHVALLALALTSVSQAALSVVTLTANSSSTSFNGTSSIGFTLDDTSFTYDPNTYSPTVGSQPARGGATFDNVGFHGNDGSGLPGSQFLRYTFSSLTTLEGGGQFVVDLWGRNHAPAYPRHESFTINLYNGAFGGAPVATLADGIAAADPSQYGRTTFNLAAGVTFDRFEIVDDTDFFTIAETRAAFETVPEPSAALLGGLGLLALLRRRR